MRHALVALCIAVASFALSWRSGADETAATATKSRPVPAQSFLPADAAAVYTMDGSTAHQPSIRETAAWKSLEDTQLVARILDLLQMLVETGGEQNGIVARQLIDHVRAEGFSAALTLRPSASGSSLPETGYAVAVLHRAEKFAPLVDRAVRTVAAQEGMPITDRAAGTRKVSSILAPNTLPGGQPEFSWWTEGGHFVLCVGIDAAANVAATVDGKSANVSNNPNWDSLRNSSEYSVTDFGWLDLELLRKNFGAMMLGQLPSEQNLTVDQILRLLGIENVRNLTVQGGFNKAETWSRTQLNGKVTETGLLSVWLNQRQLTLTELPPMPPTTSAISAWTFDTQKALQSSIGIVESFAESIAPEMLPQLQFALQAATGVLGGDPRTDLLAGLGDVWCSWFEPLPLPVPGAIAPVLAISVRDRTAVDRLLQQIQTLTAAPLAAENTEVTKTTRDGRDSYSIKLPGELGIPVVPTILVTDKWLMFAAAPGPAQTFAQRESGKLSAWKPGNDVMQAMSELPDSFSGLTVSDPRPFYESMLQVAPTGMMLLENQVLPNIGGAVELPFAITDLPAAEMVTEHLFPNVTVSGPTNDGFAWTTRQSVPSTPLGTVNASFTVPVLVALLLPAVQQAREAARRTQSMNNLKMLGIAVHNYHDSFNSFPSGTVASQTLKPNERLSWAASLLPFLEEATVYSTLDTKQPWNSQANSAALQATLSVFQNPSQRGVRQNPSSGDYIGVAGIGPDAAELPKTDPRAGVFGYDRKVGFRDITDGSSNTIMFGDASAPNVSMFAGGRDTVRGFSQSPYINGPDGFGSPHPGGMHFAFVDGSVRFFSANVDEKVLEGLATIAGSEVVEVFVD
jgi:prepilin-type processing-associated H-X9-DG protein